MGKVKNSTTNPQKDICYTPSYALCDPLMEALERLRRKVKMKRLSIWESACGNGMMVRALEAHGHRVIATDLATGGNYFTDEPIITGKRARKYHVQVTNPPYTKKYPWLDLAYARGMPFALLMQIDAWGSKEAQALFERHGVQMIWLNERIDYYMPNEGFSGDGANFSSAWYTWGLDLPKDNNFANITDAKKRFVAELERHQAEAAGQQRLLLPTLWDYAG